MESVNAETGAAAKDRRAGTTEMVRKLTEERAEVLALFCRVAGLSPFDKTKDKRALLQEFCQMLVDYVAAGHFSLYERIAAGRERRKEVAMLAEKLYPDIIETTDSVLDFNDKYDCGDHCEMGDALDDDLSKLGEILASRIELEDQLLRAITRR